MLSVLFSCAVSCCKDVRITSEREKTNEKNLNNEMKEKRKTKKIINTD